MTIRVPEPPEKYGFLHPASAFGFMTPDGRWWPSVEEWMAQNAPPSGKATDTFLENAIVNVLRLKFAFNHDIRKQLTSTGKTEIRSAKRNRDHWLGQALMQIRREFQSDSWVDLIPWTPFSEASFEEGSSQETLVRKAHGDGFIGVFINSRYQVVLTQNAIAGFNGPVDHLSIKRWDKYPSRDWREMQRIKNELCGVGREACELYPSEDRLVDTANQYHLWVLPKGTLFPFGFDDGRVVTKPGKSALAPEAKQREFEVEPEGVTTPEALDKRIEAVLES